MRCADGSDLPADRGGAGGLRRFRRRSRAPPCCRSGGTSRDLPDLRDPPRRRRTSPRSGLLGPALALEGPWRARLAGNSRRCFPLRGSVTALRDGVSAPAGGRPDGRRPIPASAAIGSGAGVGGKARPRLNRGAEASRDCGDRLSPLDTSTRPGNARAGGPDGAERHLLPAHGADRVDHRCSALGRQRSQGWPSGAATARPGLEGRSSPVAPGTPAEGGLRLNLLRGDLGAGSGSSRPARRGSGAGSAWEGGYGTATGTAAKARPAEIWDRFAISTRARIVASGPTCRSIPMGRCTATSHKPSSGRGGRVSIKGLQPAALMTGGCQEPSRIASSPQ